MTDLLKIARDRRAELQGEVARIEEFIQMAESLMRDQRLPTGPARDPRPAAAVVHEVPATGLSAEPAVDSPAEEDKGEADAAAETAEEPEDDDADEAAPGVMPAAAAVSREAGAGLTRINLLRRGPRMVTN